MSGHFIFLNQNGHFNAFETRRVENRVQKLVGFSFFFFLSTHKSGNYQRGAYANHDSCRNTNTQIKGVAPIVFLYVGLVLSFSV